MSYTLRAVQCPETNVEGLNELVCASDCASLCVCVCVCLCHVELLMATGILFSEFVFSNLKLCFTFKFITVSTLTL